MTCDCMCARQLANVLISNTTVAFSKQLAECNIFTVSIIKYNVHEFFFQPVG